MKHSNSNDHFWLKPLQAIPGYSSEFDPQYSAEQVDDT